MSTSSIKTELIQRIDDSISIQEKLGEGASAEVFSASVVREIAGLKRGKTVALKIYKPEIMRYENQMLRIERELIAGQLLKHPNLIRIFAYGTIDFHGATRQCLVMELISGSTLTDWVSKNTPISPSKVKEIFLQMAEAVRYLHSCQVIHRDLKPDNIIIDNNERIKIMDFGVCRPLSDPTITRSAQFLGTIRYSAPEYLLDLEIDEQIDAYSLGAILYFLIYGHHIFDDERLFSKLIKRVESSDPVFSISPGESSYDLCILLEVSRRLLLKEKSSRPTLGEIVREVELGIRGKWWGEYIVPLAKYRLASFFSPYPGLRGGLFPEDPELSMSAVLWHLPSELYQSFINDLSPEQWVRVWVGQINDVVYETPCLNKFVNIKALDLPEAKWQETFLETKKEEDAIAFLRTLLCIAASGTKYNDPVSSFIKWAREHATSPKVSEFCDRCQRELNGIWDVQTIS